GSARGSRRCRGVRRQPLRDRSGRRGPSARLGHPAAAPGRFGRGDRAARTHGRLRISRTTAPLVAAAGICEIAGFALYTIGAREDIAVTAVLVSLFGAVAALLARFVFRERLTRTQ